MYYIMCSYPQPHQIKGGLPTIDDAREYWYEMDLSNQTDDENFYWVEMDCPKHGRVQVASNSECQMCDIERAREEEGQVQKDDEKIRQIQETFDCTFN